MATITAGGIGSGLDVASIVSQLMAVERAPVTALEKRVSTQQSRLSVYGQIKGALSSLQTAAEALGKTDKFNAFKTTVANANLFSAASGSGAAEGNYSVEVKYLAQAHKLASVGYASSTSNVNTGNLTIELGSVAGGVFTADAAKSFNIAIDGTNNTLEGVRNAINAAKKGVTATIINDGSATPARLVITSNDSGASNTIRMSGVAGLDYEPVSNTGSLQQKVAAQDAQLTVDGIAISRSSNTITDIIPGVTLNLTKADLGNPTTLSVTTDSDKIKSNIEAFVKAYNDVNAMIKKQTAYDANTKTAGPLNGDSTMRAVTDRLRSIVVGSVDGATGGFSRLSDAGISIQADGTLKIDSTKLDAAIKDPTKDLSTLFGNATGKVGIAAVLGNEIDAMLSVDGLITNRTNGLNATIKRMNNDKAALETRMTRIEERLRAQFTALDSAMGSLNTTSQYLTQQLAKL